MPARSIGSVRRLQIRKEEIDPLLITLDNLRREIKTVEKELKRQIEFKKEKHNYKQIWLGFDDAYKNKKQFYNIISWKKITKM